MNGSTDGLTRFKLWYAIQPRGLRLIVSVNVLVFLVWVFGLQWMDAANAFVRQFLLLSPAFSAFTPVQLLAYNFLHVFPTGGLGALINIAFNMLWLFWLGKSYEELNGAHKVVGLYLMGGVAGGLALVAAGTAMPGSVSAITEPIPAILAVVCGVALRFPNQGIGLFLLGVVRLRYIAIAFLVLELLIRPGAWPALLGAALFAFVFIQQEKEGRDLAGWLKPFFGARSPRRAPSSPRASDSGILERLEARLAKKASQAPPKTTKPTRASNLRLVDDATIVAEFDQSEIDRILDKISESGYESLSADEKRTLYEASKK